MAASTVWILLMCAVFIGQGSKAQDCGLAPLNTRAVGGVNATAGSWPWQVSVFITVPGIQYLICGGSLISDQWVLTAAHCIPINSTDVYLLYLGRETLLGPNVNEVKSSVSQIIVHPDFNIALLNNDIALMKLSSPVNFTNNIRPICLASNSSQFHNSTPCWATGWGRLGLNRTFRPFNSLQEVQVPVIGQNQCRCTYQPVSSLNITDEMMCAGQQSQGLCPGDTGGPLQCKQGSRWIQAGIGSLEVSCFFSGFPDIYTRVSEFQTWITDQVAGANVGFVTFNSSGIDQDDSFVCRSASTAAPTTTSTAAPTTMSTAAPTTTCTASTVAADLMFVVILAIVILQHTVANHDTF